MTWLLEGRHTSDIGTLNMLAKTPLLYIKPIVTMAALRLKDQKEQIYVASSSDPGLAGKPH